MLAGVQYQITIISHRDLCNLHMRKRKMWRGDSGFSISSNPKVMLRGHAQPTNWMDKILQCMYILQVYNVQGDIFNWDPPKNHKFFR